MDGNFTDTGSCNFQRLLCVTCRQDAATNWVYIRVQTNTNPNFCWNEEAWWPKNGLGEDFEVRWN